MIDILIADDNAVLTEQLSKILSREKDFRILKVSKDGVEALKDYISLKPTVLLLDLNLPKMSGIDVIEELSKSYNFDSKNNIIIVSGDTLFRSQLSNTQKIRWILPKPIDYDKLIYEIREIKKEENFKPTFKEDLDVLFSKLDIKPYTKGSTYLKNAIYIAYYDDSKEINISNITKKIAVRYNVSNSDSIQSSMDKTVSTLYPRRVKDDDLKRVFTSDYKITTKDFISRALYYMNNT